MYTNNVATTTNSDNHMWLFTAPNGKLFHAGPAKTTHYLSLEGQGSVVEKAARGSGDTMNGNALMYDIAKILTLGGSADYDNFLGTDDGSLGTDEAHIITLDGTGMTDDVTIEPVPNGLVYARVMSNSVILPNGQVVVVGGMVRALTATLEGAILAAELFDPVTKTFTEMASMSEARNYHSSAILLQDGRVWAGGGGHCSVRACKEGGATNKFNCEIYTPPYLVDPATNQLTTQRPFITNAPTRAVPGGTITVTTAAAVQTFALVRLSAATHSTNNDSRRVPLVPTATVGTTYTLTLPRAAICLPGTYFLFVMDDKGVPSVATTISIRP
jgi:galactose oxidase